jgi:hypothetical protein
MTMPILQVIPRLAPRESGVGDYAECLADTLEQAHGIRSTFVAATEKADPGPVNPGRFAAALRRAAFGQSALVLHYVGYGYARRGAPLWLPRLLREVRGARPLPLVTIFHELYALGRPWQSSFWLSPLQRRIAGQLARASDAILTPRTTSARWLRACSKGAPIYVLPVFSNIGEPAAPPHWDRRVPALVLFGQASFKQAVLADAPRLLAVCRKLGVEALVNIGAPVPMPASIVGALRVSDRGVLDAADVSHVLQSSRYLAFNYFPGHLGKSSILASAAAHGTVPVGFGVDGDAPEGLLAGTHVWGAEALLRGHFELDGERTSAALQAWYRSHDRAAHARTLSAALRELVARAA